MGSGPGASWAPRLLALACAALCGAAGLGLEAVLISTAGLSLGQGRAGALGIGLFVTGWSLGAWLAGRSRRSPAAGLAAAGMGAALASIAAPQAILWAGASAPGGVGATLGTALAIALAALPQGAFLPLLVRARERAVGSVGVAGIFASNLAGGVLGAWWIGYVAVGALGRPAAALCAGGAALAAALGALPLARTRSSLAPGPAPRPSAPGKHGLRLAQAAWVIGTCTLWVVGVEWIALRLAVLWIGSLQSALTSVLAASLLALALGAALVPALVHRDGRGVLETLALALAGSLWPLFAAPALAAVRARLASAGPLAASLEDPLTALFLVGPALVAFGGIVPVLHRALPGESGLRLGSLLLHESWGALLAGPAVHWGLVPSLGLGGALAALAGLAAPAALALSGTFRRAGPALAAVAIAAALLASRARPPALDSPKLAEAALELRSLAEDGEFTVAVIDDGILGERALLTDQFRAAGTGRDYRYMRVLGHLPVLLHPEPRRVAVLALGTGTTLGAVALHPEVEEIDVLELSRAVVEQAPWFEAVNRGVLAEGLPGLLQREPGERVRVFLEDGRCTLGRARGHYDVITMEPLLPDSPFGVYLYTREFYGVVHRALAPGGLCCQWVPPHALEPEVFDAVVDAFARAFPRSSLWVFGTQVILVGGDAAPELDPARFPAPEAAAGDGRGEAHSELRAALAELGLDDPAGLAARYVVSLADWPRSERPLTDADPWIAFRRKPRGVRVLTWLPANLEHAIARSSAPPEAWQAAIGEDAKARIDGVRALREARVAHARAELLHRLGQASAAEARAISEEALAPALELAPGDPEVRELAGEIRFLGALRSGVAMLDAGAARAALEPLLDAAELRAERADVHLYVAGALARAGELRGAQAAAARALELCPRAAETAQGRRAIELGLDASMLEPRSSP